MDKLISFMLFAAVLFFNIEGLNKYIQSKISQRANKRTLCKNNKGRICIEEFQLAVDSTNGIVTHDLIRNTTVDLNGLHISTLNFTCSACGSSISRIVIKRYNKMLNRTKHGDRKTNCTRIGYVTDVTKRGHYSCEVEKSHYKTVKASVHLRLKSTPAKAMTTKGQNYSTETKTVTEITTMTKNMTNSTESKFEVERPDSSLTNTTESRVCYFFLGLLFFATMATLVVAFRYRRKYRRYRHNFITISRRLADLNEKPRHRNTQMVEDAYTNPNCQAAKTEVHDRPLRREVEPLYVNSNLPPVDTDRYVSNEGLIYISLGSSRDLMKPGRSKKIRNKKGKISYSTIDYDKTGKVTIVSKVNDEDEKDNKIYQNCPPIIRRII